MWAITPTSHGYYPPFSGGNFSPAIRLGGMVPQRLIDTENMNSNSGGQHSSGGGGCNLTAMNFRAAVNQVATRYIKNIDASELLKTKRMFLEWKSEPDKLDVMHMYRNSGWRAIYTQNLFLPRIQTVEFTVQRLLSIRQACNVLSKATKYVSLGCGPGPCISSVILVLRRDLGVTHNLNFTGVDQFIGWKPYIESLSSVDAGTRVGFQQLLLNESTVTDVPAGEVAIMSYTDAAVHTPAFWEGLRERYSLIIILDQNKSALGGMLRRQEFRMVEYQFKGHKRFYYQVPRKKLKPPPPPCPPAKISETGKETPTTSEQETTKSSHKAVTKTPTKLDVVKPLSQMNELKQVELCMNGNTIAKTKCGTGTGKYSGALEPQKRMTAERMNQLLRAKLLAMDELIHSDSTLSEDSPVTNIKEEAFDSSVTSLGGDNNSVSDSENQIKEEEIKKEEYQVIPVLSRPTRTFVDDFPMEFRMNPIFQQQPIEQASDPIVSCNEPIQQKDKSRGLSSISPICSTAVNNATPQRSSRKSAGFDLRQVLSERRKAKEAAANASSMTYFGAGSSSSVFPSPSDNSFYTASTCDQQTLYTQSQHQTLQRATTYPTSSAAYPQQHLLSSPINTSTAAYYSGYTAPIQAHQLSYSSSHYQASWSVPQQLNVLCNVPTSPYDMTAMLSYQQQQNLFSSEPSPQLNQELQPHRRKRSADHFTTSSYITSSKR